MRRVTIRNTTRGGGSRRRRAFGAAAVAMLVCGAASLSAAADFGAAFAQLRELGLPDVRDAEYVRLHDGSSDYDADGIADDLNRHLEEAIDLDGDAWLMPAESGAPGRAVVTRQLERYRMFDSAEQAGGAKAFSGEFAEADLAADLALLVDVFEKLLADPDPERFEYSGAAGEVIAFAAHAHRHGEEDAANRLVSLVMAVHPEPEAPLRDLITELGPVRFDKISDEFFADPDWTRYRDALRDTAARFPDWEVSSVLEHVADEVTKRIENPMPPDFAAADIPPEHRALLRELVEPNKPLPSFRADQAKSEGLWTLGGGNHDDPAEDPPDNPAEQLLSHGFSAVPALIALLEHDYYIPMDRAFLHLSRYESPVGRGASIMEDEFARHLANMRRPVTTREVAEYFLEPVLFGQDAGAARDSWEALREDAQAWFRRFQGALPAELAVAYLEEGHPGQKELAARFLVESGEATGIGAVREFVLQHRDFKSLAERLSLVRSLAQSDPAAHADIVTEFVRALETAAETPHENTGDFPPEAIPRILEFSRSLLEMVSPKSADDILAEIIDGTARWPTALEALGQRLQRLPPDEAIAFVLDAAVNPGVPPGARTAFLFRLSRLDLSGDDDTGSGGPDMMANKDRWAAALAEDTASPSLANGIDLTVAQAAAWVFEFLHGDRDSMQGLSQLVSALGPQPLTVVRERASAGLAGIALEDRPEIPTDPALTGDEASAKLEEIAGMEPDDASAALTALSLGEALAVVFAAEDLDSEELFQKLSAVTNRIVQVEADVPEPLASVRDAVESLKANPFSQEAMKAFATSLGEVEFDRPWAVVIKREPMTRGGIEVEIREDRAVPQDEHVEFEQITAGREDPLALPVVIGRIRGPYVSDTALLSGSSPAAGESDDAPSSPDDDLIEDDLIEEGDDEGAASFYYTLSMLNTFETNPLHPLRVSFRVLPSAALPSPEPTNSDQPESSDE